jgi:hypothetical protein
MLKCSSGRGVDPQQQLEHAGQRDAVQAGWADLDVRWQTRRPWNVAPLVIGQVTGVVVEGATGDVQRGDHVVDGKPRLVVSREHPNVGAVQRQGQRVRLCKWCLRPWRLRVDCRETQRPKPSPPTAQRTERWVKGWTGGVDTGQTLSCCVVYVMGYPPIIVCSVARDDGVTQSSRGVDDISATSCSSSIGIFPEGGESGSRGSIKWLSSVSPTVLSP